MDTILFYLPPILMYILGVMGLYTFSKAIYRIVKYRELPWSNLVAIPSLEESVDITSDEIPLPSFTQFLKVVSIIIMMPFIGACAAIVIQDSMLWLNREFGLGLTFFTSWYGPNMEILR